MIRFENASKLLNNSTGDVEFRMCLLTHEKCAAAESIIYVMILLKLRNAEVV